MHPQLVIVPENPTSAAVQELIAELDCYLETLYPPESRHGLNIAALQDQSVTLFIARIDNKLIGCGAIKLLTGYAEIKRMYVRPNYRGKGVAREILRQLEAFAKQANIHTLRLETGIYQPEAIALYQKCGFSPIPPFGDYQPDPLCLFFEKPLTIHDSQLMTNPR